MRLFRLFAFLGLFIGFANLAYAGSCITIPQSDSGAQLINDINNNFTYCSSAGSVPSGTNAQIVGYNGSNVPASYTLTGDITFSGSYVATVVHFNLTSASSANSNRITSVGTDTTTGDALSRGQSTLASLAGVTLTSPTSGQCLAYNGTAWVNSSSCGGGGGGYPSGSPAYVAGYNSSSVGTAYPIIGDLSLAISLSNYVATVGRVNGVTYPSGPSTHTIPVVTGTNAVTYELAPVEAGGRGCGNATSYASLPVSPVIGTECTVSDANSCVAGTAVSSGGGTTPCDVWYSGSAWLPAGGATASGGSGSGFPLTTNVSAAGYQIQNLGSLTSSGSGLGTIGSFSVNGVINVQASPYNAVGNGSTDDTTAIQSALTAACAGSVPRPEVYFPYTGNCYFISAPLHIPCGNIAVNGPMQGQNACIAHSFVGDTFLASTPGGSPLQFGSAVVGSGNSLNLKSYTANGDGVVSYNPILNSGLTSDALGGLGSFDVEYVYKVSAVGGGDVQPLFGSSVTLQAADHGATNPVFNTYLDSSDVLHAAVNTVSSGFVNLPTSNQSLNTCYDVAVDKSGSSCRLFVNGTQVGSTTTCTGNLVMDPYEVITAPSMQTARWPLGGFLNNPPTGFIDTIRVEKASTHTSSYTSLCASNTKQTADSNTLILDNFVTPTTQQEDSDPVITGNNPSANAFLPILSGGQPGYGSLHLSYLEMCAISNSGNSGVFAQNTFQSEYDHLFCTHNSYIGIDLTNAPYETYVHDNSIQGGSLCIDYSKFAEGVSGYNLCNQGDQASLHTCYNYDSSSDADFYAQCQDVDNPGDLVFPWIEYLSHNHYTFPFLDAEFGNSTEMKAQFLDDTSYAPETIDHFEGNTRNNAPLLLQNGGSPIHINDLDWADQPASQVIGFINLPSGPDLIENSVLPSNGNAFCTGSDTPNSCCSGAGTGTCVSPVPLSTSNPLYVDSIDNTYDNSVAVANLLNGGLTVPSLNAGFAIVGESGFTCQKQNSGNNATLSVAKPPCSQPGVIEVCAVEAAGTPTLAISGWTQIGTTTASGDSNSEAGAWWRLAPVSESSTISITGASSYIIADCGVITGVDPIVPIDGASGNPATSGHNFGSNPSAATGTITVGNSNDVMLTFAGFNTSGVAASNINTPTGQPSTATQLGPFIASGSGNVLIGNVWQPTGSTSAAVTYALTGSSGSEVTFAIAFSPLSGNGPGPAMAQTPIDLGFSPTLFANLPSAPVGTVRYCNDCTAASNPCTGSGSGTFAFRINSGSPAWKCL